MRPVRPRIQFGSSLVAASPPRAQVGESFLWKNIKKCYFSEKFSDFLERWENWFDYEIRLQIHFWVVARLINKFCWLEKVTPKMRTRLKILRKTTPLPIIVTPLSAWRRGEGRTISRGFCTIAADFWCWRISRTLEISHKFGWWSLKDQKGSNPQ